MNRPHLSKRLAASLGSALLLTVVLVSSAARGVTPASSSLTDPSPSRLALLQPVPAPQVALPATANDTTRAGREQLAAMSHFLSGKSYSDLQEFVARVSDGYTEVVRGVFVPDIFGLPVVQQPKDQAIFVSSEPRSVTQFGKAEKNGVTGLLAHNYLAGRLFYQLRPGQDVMIVYGDGTVKHYRITDIYRFQKLVPSNLYSDLVDLSSGARATSSQVFNRFYRGQDQLVFQTCLESGGKLNWGLTFIVATPMDGKSDEQARLGQPEVVGP
jgi:hypothetical protein